MEELKQTVKALKNCFWAILGWHFPTALKLVPPCRGGIAPSGV